MSPRSESAKEVQAESCGDVCPRGPEAQEQHKRASAQSCRRRICLPDEERAHQHHKSLWGSDQRRALLQVRLGSVEGPEHDEPGGTVPNVHEKRKRSYVQAQLL